MDTKETADYPEAPSPRLSTRRLCLFCQILPSSVLLGRKNLESRAGDEDKSS